MKSATAAADFRTPVLNHVVVRHKCDFLLRGALRPAGQALSVLHVVRSHRRRRHRAGAKRVQADYVVLPSMFMHYTAALRQPDSE